MAGRRLIIESYMPCRDADGEPVSGALLTTYLNETTTPATVYSDKALTIPHTNPVEANGSGVFPAIWAAEDAVFTVSISDADENPIFGLRNLDNVRPTITLLASQGSSAVEDSIALDALEASEGDHVQSLGRDYAGDWGGGFWTVLEGDYSSEVAADPAGAIWRPFDGEDGSTRVKKRTSTPDIWAFGGKGDAVQRVDGVAVSGDATFTSAGASFTSADVGKYISLEGVGAAGVSLKTTIAAVNSATSIELAVAPSTSRAPGTGSVNAVAFTTGRILAGFYELVVTGASFTSALIGTAVVINGAGTAGATLNTTVAAYKNATTLILAAPAVTTVGGVGFSYASADPDDSTQTADTLAIQRMLNAGKAVFLPRRTPAGNNTRWLITDTIQLPSTGSTITAESQEVVIEGDDFDGPVLDVLWRRTLIGSVTIDATYARRQMTFAWGRCGIRYGGPDQLGVQTSSWIEKVTIRFQPGCGVEKLRTGSFSWFNLVTIDDCKGHGWYGSDGTRQGLVSDRPGIYTLNLPSIHGCGGQAVLLDEDGSTHLRVKIDNADFGNCCWYAGTGTGTGPGWAVMSGGIPNLREAQVVLRGGNISTPMIAISDRDYGNRPNPRTSRGTLIYVSSQSTDIEITGKTRLMNGDVLVDIADGNTNVIVDVDYTNYGPTDDESTASIPIGVRYGDDCTGLARFARLTKTIAGPTTIDTFTTPLRVGGGSVVRAFAEEQPYFPITDNNAWFADGGYEVGTISGGLLIPRAEHISVVGEGGVADTLAEIYLTAGKEARGLPEGYTIVLYNKQSYDITLAHLSGADGNLNLIGNCDKVLRPSEAITLKSTGDGEMREMGSLDAVPVNATIASGVLTTTARVVNISGEGDVADDLSRIRFTSGDLPIPDGHTVTLINTEAYAILLKHAATGVGEFSLPRGSDKILRPGRSVTLTSYGSKFYGGGDLPDGQTGGGVLVQADVSATYDITAAATFQTVATATVTVPAGGGWYDFRGALHINHRDSAGSVYQGRIYDNSTNARCGSQIAFAGAGPDPRPMNFGGRRRFLAEGSHQFDLQVQQLTYTTVYGQVLSGSIVRPSYMEILPAAQ